MNYNNSRLAQWAKALDLMQEVVGSNPRRDKFFLNIFFTKTDCKSLYREKGNPCADYREALFGIQGNHVGITGKPLLGLQANPVEITGNSL